MILRTGRLRVVALLAALILLGGLLGPTSPASAADGTLVIAALHVLEREYVEPVHSIDLLNAAVAALREATHQSAAALPDIPSYMAGPEAENAFLANFARALVVGPISETQLAYAATRGMLTSLHDSHTFYLDPRQLQESRAELLGRPGFTGIGVILTSRTDGAGRRWLFVEDVIPGAPAEAAGIRRFDRIVAVNGSALGNLTVPQASQLIRGPAGSTVVIAIQRGDQTLNISVERAPIRSEPAQVRFVQPGVAYARLYSFSRGSGLELANALQALADQGPIRSIILDLRGNPGGLILEAARVAGVFLPRGTVLARVQDRQDGPSLLRSEGVAPFADTPLVVLIDGGSASASEIIAGAFKDHHRATIVGDKSAGALGGAVDLRLPEGGMSVTVERILTPEGTQVEGTGIAPDAAVSLTVADMMRGEDTQLQAALHAIGALLTGHRVRAA
jgi:carboxyl-terminal processing protease